MFYSDVMHNTLENYRFSTEVRCGKSGRIYLWFFLFQSTWSTMVNRNGGMEHSILPKAEYLIGPKSLYFLIQRNSAFYIAFDCFPVFFFFSSQQHKASTYPQTANTPMQNGPGNQSEVLHAIWWTKRFKGDFCCLILTKIPSNVVCMNRDY